MTATLVCSGLRKSFGERVAVDGVEFSIAAGETYGLLGPNGAGKTTTISMVCGLLTRDAGEILLEGRAFDTTSIDAKASIGLVPQEIAIYPICRRTRTSRSSAACTGFTIPSSASGSPRSSRPSGFRTGPTIEHRSSQAG